MCSTATRYDVLIAGHPRRRGFVIRYLRLSLTFDSDRTPDSMVVLRCTQKLLVRLKRTDVSLDTESTTRLGDWYANILRIGRQQYVLFISEHSRLPVIVRMSETRRLETIFADAVCAALGVVGVASDYIADERSRLSTIAFGKTRSRSLLGTLNDFAFMAQYGNGQRQEPEQPEDLMRFLARTPILPLAGANPIELTRAAFSSRSSH